MHMVMVVIADRRRLTRPVWVVRRVLVGMVVTVLVAVVPEMNSVARSVFQRIADTHRCRVGGVQREHDGKKKKEASTHGDEHTRMMAWRKSLLRLLFIVIPQIRLLPVRGFSARQGICQAG